jgi:hypothetical protein
MKCFLIIGSVLLSLLVSAQNQSDQHLIFGSPYSSQVTQVCADNQGNVYVAGEFSKSLLMGTYRLKDTWGGFVAKLDANNSLVWLQRADVQTKGLEIKNDKLYIIAQFSKHGVFGEEELENGSNTFNALVAEVDIETGLPKWKNYLKSEQDVFAADICVDESGNTYFTGGFQGLLKVGDHQLEAKHFKNNYLGKINSKGKIEWIKRISGGEDIITGISVSAITNNIETNELIITGELTGKAWFDDELISSKRIELEYGFYYQNEVYIASIDNTGKWKNVYSVVSEATSNDIICVKGNVYICGYFQGTIHQDYEPGISVFGNNIELTSGIGKAGNLLETMYVAAFKNDSALWAFAPKGINSSRMISLSYDNDNNIYAGGFFYDQIDLPDGTRYTATNKEFSSNMLMLQFSKNGELLNYEGADVKNSLKLIDLSYGKELVIGGQVTGKSTIKNVNIDSRGKHHNGFIFRFFTN